MAETQPVIAAPAAKSEKAALNLKSSTAIMAAPIMAAPPAAAEQNRTVMQDSRVEERMKVAVEGFYSEREVTALTSLHRTTIWRLIKQGLFPAPVPLSPGRVGWSRSSINGWVRFKLRASAEGISRQSPKPQAADPTLERDDDLIPIAEVARGRGVKPKTVLELAKRDPDHPPLISLTDNPRARKFLRRGDNKAYERWKIAEAEQRHAERIARSAAKQAEDANTTPETVAPENEGKRVRGRGGAVHARPPA